MRLAALFASDSDDQSALESIRYLLEDRLQDVQKALNFETSIAAREHVFGTHHQFEEKKWQRVSVVDFTCDFCAGRTTNADWDCDGGDWHCDPWLPVGAIGVVPVKVDGTRAWTPATALRCVIERREALRAEFVWLQRQLRLLTRVLQRRYRAESPRSAGPVSRNGFSRHRLPSRSLLDGEDDDRVLPVGIPFDFVNRQHQERRRWPTVERRPSASCAERPASRNCSPRIG